MTHTITLRLLCKIVKTLTWGWIIHLPFEVRTFWRPDREVEDCTQFIERYGRAELFCLKSSALAKFMLAPSLLGMLVYSCFGQLLSYSS